MKSIFQRFFGKGRVVRLKDMGEAHSPSRDGMDGVNHGFPLVPDNYHLRDVGKILQGNGYWIDVQLAVDENGTRDFVAAYIFDAKGDLISCDVVDLGYRSEGILPSTDETIRQLKKKIDAGKAAEILVKPFSTSYFGHTFGLVMRESESGSETAEDIVIDAMPGHTLMFYGPWGLCNYDT